MPNSSFQKNNSTPVTVPEGGIGVSFVPYGEVLIGSGSGNVNTVSPGAIGNILKSDGTNWTSGTSDVSDGSVTYPKIATDLTQIIDLSTSNNIDWSMGGIYTKTLTSNTTLTFSNYKLNKSILLKIDGNYSLALPTTVKKISGTYSGTNINYIFLHCTKDTSPQEVWATINQKNSSSDYGFFAGGYEYAPVSTAEKIVFSTGATSANTVSNLSQAKHSPSGVSDTIGYGYFSGGDTVGSGSLVKTSDRIVFSTGVTSANTVSNLSIARRFFTSVSDGLNYGYFAGGSTSTSTVYTAITDRIIFSTGATSANTVSNLSQARYGVAGVSDALTYGYFGGGDTNTASNVVTTDRIVFSTGITSVNTVSNISVARRILCGLSDSVLYGYFAGGLTGGSSADNTVLVDKITFSTGATSANTVSNLSQARYGLAGVSTADTAGYFSGGYGTSGIVATSDRIIFSTGVTSANTASNLSQARYCVAGVSACSV